MRPEQLILKGVVGSQAYGMATAESDRDYGGIWVADPVQVLGVTGFAPSFVQHEPEDFTAHELGKFAKLAANANPTVLEVLWLGNYEYLSVEALRLLQARDLFLSRHARNTYGGYVRQQARRLVNRGGTFDPDLTKRTEKHGRHCMRLLLQGSHLAEHGELVVRLGADQVTSCREAGRMAQEDPEGFAAMCEDAVRAMDDLFDSSPLPEKPDLDRISELIMSIRFGEWRRRSLL